MIRDGEYALVNSNIIIIIIIIVQASCNAKFLSSDMNLINHNSI